MTNEELVNVLEETIGWMDLMEFNSFKINAYKGLVQQIENSGTPLRNLEETDIKGKFTKNMAQVVLDLLATESFPERDQLIATIPHGVRSMLKINGIGPKKVNVLWKDAGISDIAQLKNACEKSLVSQIKGFGLKIQETILQGIVFLESVEGKLQMHKGEKLATELESHFSMNSWDSKRVGDLVMKSEVVSAVEFLFPMENRTAIRNWLANQEMLEWREDLSGPFHCWCWHRKTEAWVGFHFARPEEIKRQTFVLNSNTAHWAGARQNGLALYPSWKKGFEDEGTLFQVLGRAWVSPELRGSGWEWKDDFESKNEKLIQYETLRGCLHNHSTYSDGKNTLLEMATACKENGWSYFGIADHSQTAVYANGLDEERVFQQWNEIDKLNQSNPGFRILKGIESDILPDGSLDYPDPVLVGFDYVVASVHAGMKMDKNTATQRLIRAIEHPSTRILGHCSGRILLRRPGYPLDYDRIIDACLANKVSIELNAHPARLDMDWQNLVRALDKGIIISINPDAHEVEGLEMMRYGTWLARKAGAEKSQVLNAFELPELLKFFSK
jgi:DNA polymerase (family 10)